MSRVFAELVKLGMSEESAGEIAEFVRPHERLTKQDLRAALAELRADLFRHTTDTLIKLTAIYAGLVLVELAIFAFAMARLLERP